MAAGLPEAFLVGAGGRDCLTVTKIIILAFACGMIGVAGMLLQARSCDPVEKTSHKKGG